MKSTFTAICAAAALSACATVNQSDLDAWVGVPVEALDTHSLFATLPMKRSLSSSGIEVRSYVNGGGQQCSTSVVFKQLMTDCRAGPSCTNTFYIKDGKVAEYLPTGRCETDESVRPEARYLRLMAPAKG